MNRNQNSRFALNPTSLDISRSKFDRPSRHITTFNVSDLIPHYVDEILPGDTHTIKTNKVLRLQTLLTPFYGNMYADTYYFFVPMRLVWEHTKQFFGESNQAWTPSVEYTTPKIKCPSGGWNKGTIADYMGIPTGVDGLPKINALPFRAYALICNEFFRDQNLSDPLNIPVNDSDQQGTNGSSYINDVANGGMPFKASKFHDYFTSCLPAPQKGDAVRISLGDSATVYGDGKALGLFAIDSTSPITKYGLTSKKDDTLGEYLMLNSNSYDTFVGVTPSSGAVSPDLRASVGLLNKPLTGSVSTGVYADLSSTEGVAINDLRLAFQTQKYLEACARGGTRYIELIKSMFGVTSPDARLQRPEYLGGSRVPINTTQIVQSSETGTTPQGNTTAYSLTTDSHFEFTRSFTEHGYIIGLTVVRYDHMYQQGIEKMWFRDDKLSYYWPIFANLGEMPVYNKQIYAQSDSVVDTAGNIVNDKVFGYQEAWAEYRYKPDRISGEMRSTYSASLDSWHLGDEYSSLPALSDSWIREDGNTVDRILAVSQRVADQILADFYIVDTAVRPMPVNSIPGLIDHH